MARRLVSGGLVLTPAFTAAALDIVLEDDTIAALVPRGTPVAEAETIYAAGTAVMPGLVNGHVHGHGTLAKGLVDDRWPLELFLNALPGLGANRAAQDKHLNGLLGAVEMVRKGCTACYDLFFEFPQPSPEGLFALGAAYDAIGIRAVVAPMVADRTFYGAYPELMAVVPEPLRTKALALQMAPAAASLASARAAFAAWPFDRDRIRPGIAPTIPLHCSDEFLTGCGALAEEFDLVMQTHLAESKPQAVIGRERYGRTLTAHLVSLNLLCARSAAASTCRSCWARQHSSPTPGAPALTMCVCSPSPAAPCSWSSASSSSSAMPALSRLHSPASSASAPMSPVCSARLTAFPAVNRETIAATPMGRHGAGRGRGLRGLSVVGRGELHHGPDLRRRPRLVDELSLGRPQRKLCRSVADAQRIGSGGCDHQESFRRAQKLCLT
jgi:hypothetical protein